MFARARRPPSNMAGCALVCSVRPTLADGRRAAGPVKAAAEAARATTSFILVWRLETCPIGSFFKTGSTDREPSDLVCLLH